MYSLKDHRTSVITVIGYVSKAADGPRQAGPVSILPVVWADAQAYAQDGMDISARISG
jgi:hypothetical protein